MELTDAQALLASRIEPQAFAALVHRHHTSLHRYLARRVGADLADDLLADVFAAAFAQRDRYDESRTDAAPWLFGIATNVVRRHRRTEVRRLRAYARTGRDPALPSGGDELDGRLDAIGQGRALAGALASLPRRHRDALLLHALGDLPVAEVAQALDVPLGTAKAWLARGRARARAHLEGQTRSTLPEPCEEVR